MENKYNTPRARKIYPIPAHWNGKSQTTARTREIHGNCLHEIWNLNQNIEYTAFYLQSEWDLVGESIKERLIKDEEYLPTVYAKQREGGEKLVALSQQLRKVDFTKFSLEDLIKTYHQLEAAWMDHDNYNVPPWFFGGDFFHKFLLEKLQTDYKIAESDSSVLLTPAVPSFSSEEERLMYEVALAAVEANCDWEKDIPDNISEKIDQLVEKFYWIPYGYDGPTLYDREHYLKTVGEIIKTKTPPEISVRLKELQSYESDMRQKHHLICKKYNISDLDKHFLEIVYTLALMTDQRKEFTFQAHEIFQRTIAQMAERLGIKPLCLRYLLIEEIEAGKADPKELESLADKRIAGSFIMYWKDGQCEIWDEEKTKEFIAGALPKEEGVEIIKGQIGSKGPQAKTTGKVRVLHTSIEIGKLQDGEILVTAMTSPEYVPAMRKSSAIITDEGGITCHAAIVSRELNIPCVIGTRNATKILKDGDIVEVDSENGIIKIINK